MKTEKILSIIFIISLIFKFFGWPGGSAILIISLMSLTFCYFPFGFYFLNEKNVFKQKLGTSILFGWLLPVAIIGVQFKFMYWPAYHPMLVIGILTAAIFLVIAYGMYKKANTEETKYYHKNLLTRTLVIFIVSLITLLIPEKSIINMSFQNEPELKELYLKKVDDPNNMELQKEIEEYHKHRFQKQ
ncbi:hypothetical protein [Flavobacterium urocaniciphilum]|uniref:Uncharacterized protein n=1 Tax=Flavobacterium urocaniciphilum TaxID=1299341 RepID=A0A1H8ZE69_9FLAO|nr:hypothetical protein [Flavobacterium urocaniciphilum]SEP62655.1 hypothetical protein SAMN05444005_101658 [Flavobacterium urocaniciphilum]